MIKKIIGKIINKLYVLIPLLIAITGISVFAYQVWFLAIRGHWKPLCSRIVLDIILPTNFVQWLDTPDSCLALNRIIFHLFNFPLSLSLIMLSLATLLLISKVSDLLKSEKSVMEKNINSVIVSEQLPKLYLILSSQNGNYIKK